MHRRKAHTEAQMLTDHYGNPISTSSLNAQSHYDLGVKLFLEANYGAVEAFAAAIEADPDFALAHVASARALMMTGNMAAAKTALGRAQSAVKTGTARKAIGTTYEPASDYSYDESDYATAASGSGAVAGASGLRWWR